MRVDDEPGGDHSLKQDAPFFEGRNAKLVYIAKRMSDATELEELLTRNAVDYGVEADTYTGGAVFRSERVGAFFYVLPEIEQQVRELMRTNGFRPAVTDDD